MLRGHQHFPTRQLPTARSAHLEIINSPTAQKARAALIFKLDHESPDDWAQLLEEIGENDNVTLAWRDDGGVQIFWVVPKED